MRISFNTRLKSTETLKGVNGFGYATQCALGALNDIGYEVSINDPTADVAFCFDQPPHMQRNAGQYSIAYMPWESTEMDPGWIEKLNTFDEVWTPSPLIAEWFRALVTPPVYVWEHGIAHDWYPHRRTQEGTLKFLVIGAEACRKNAWETASHFKKAFSGRGDDVSMTIKAVRTQWNAPPSLGRFTYINKTMGFEELQELFYSHHVLLHCSSGEGFGFPPLQALASGMPVVTLPAWAPYRDFLDPRLSVDSKLVKSPWQHTHPGKVFRPDWRQVKQAMRDLYDDYDSFARDAYEVAPVIHQAYDWQRVTEAPWNLLKKRLEIP